jgi:hypothetical protein
MKQDKFDEIVKQTLNQASEVLLVKAKEYVRNDNPMHNFDEGARKKGIIREKVIDGFALKHEISIDDIVNDIESGKLPSYDMVNEKFGDAINYLILKKASILDRMDNKELPF